VHVKRINPIFLLIALNILLVLFRTVILPEEVSAALAAGIESTLLRLGVLGYLGIVIGYVLCGFFFVPLLMPLNILGGALYGAYVGTAVAVAGITLGSVASTVSARYVFTGMQSVIDKRPGLRRLLDRADNHGSLTIIMVRFAVVVPYLWQNIALAATRSSAVRIGVITAVSAIPGAAIYSFLGAGLVQSEDMKALIFYLTIPVALMLLMIFLMGLFKARFEGSSNEPADR
jgi:uncharacterized membrane protein YdjX (TVP38/TMEM64 family)